MSPLNVIYYFVALVLPIALFTEILGNANETHPLLVFVVCIALMTAAGLLSVPGKLKVDGKTGGKIKWVGLSAFVGLVEAIMLVFMV